MHLYYIIRQIYTGWKQLTPKHSQASLTHSLYTQHLFGRLLQRPIHLRTRIYIRRALYYAWRAMSAARRAMRVEGLVEKISERDFIQLSNEKH